MFLRNTALMLLTCSTFFLAGCGGGESTPPEGVPESAPEPESADYDAYNSAGKSGPGGGDQGGN